MPELVSGAARHFIDDLRNVRADVLADAEAFDQILFAIERLGGYLLGRCESLSAYRERLRSLVVHSPLAGCDDAGAAGRTQRFERLFDLIKEARNDALHQGAAARHIARHCVEMALILEDSLMSGAKQAGDFMVSSPIEAKLFEPVGSIRRTMLMHAFSYLPIKTSDRWMLVSDVAVARFLRSADSNATRKKRLGMSIREAVDVGGLKLVSPGKLCTADDDLSQLLIDLDERPVLVLCEHRVGSDLVGLITPFDLL